MENLTATMVMDKYASCCVLALLLADSFFFLFFTPQCFYRRTLPLLTTTHGLERVGHGVRVGLVHLLFRYLLPFSFVFLTLLLKLTLSTLGHSN